MFFALDSEGVRKLNVFFQKPSVRLNAWSIVPLSLIPVC